MSSNKPLVDLLTRARNYQIVVFLSDDQVKIKLPKGAVLPPDMIPLLTENKEKIRQFLRCAIDNNQEMNLTFSPAISLDKEGRNNPPLSFSQQGLWIVDMLRGHSEQFNMPTLLTFKGHIDKDHLEYAFRQIINRHQVLRTVFKAEDGVPYQFVLPPDQWHMSYYENPQLKDKDTLDACIRAYGSMPFDLSADAMLRAKLVRLSEDEYVIMVVFHHIAIDGWSMSILVKELFELYQAASNGKIPCLPDLPLQYIDYATWQRSYFSAELLDKKLEYWEQKLEGLTHLDLPLDYSRPAQMSIKAGCTGLSLDKELTAKLRILAQKEGVTVYILLLAVFKVLLYRHSGNNDICVGTPVANRMHKELELLIGFFPNSLALRSNLTGNPRFKDLLAAVKETLLEAFTNQDTPFEKVVDRVEKSRDMSRSPLFQVMFIYMNDMEPELRLGNATFTVEHFPYEPARFDLTLYLDEKPSGIELNMIYCSDLFTSSTVQRVLTHYQALLQSVLLNPEEKIGKLPMLNPAEKYQILHAFNQTSVDFPASRTVVDLFVERALDNPGHTAAVCNGESITYEELDKRSNKLANYLKGKGVDPQSPVCVCMDRSLSLLISMLAIMKAGCVYLPLDPEYPQDRLDYILEDSKSRWVITQTEQAAKSINNSCEFILIDSDKELISLSSDEMNFCLPCPDDLAYIIYTSGSTGRPKGVMIEHKGMLNHLYAKINEFSINEQSRVLQNASQSFDISIWQFLAALVCGGKTFIYSQETILDSGLFLDNIYRDGLTHVEVVPSYLQALLADSSNDKRSLPALKYLLVTGETLPAFLARQWFERFPGLPLVNAYGPTEASDDITHFIMTGPPYHDKIPIGHVVQNMQIYVFTPLMELCPLGVHGEIGVAGIGVGQGYLNNPQLTAEKFVTNPFAPQSGYKLYKTGDTGYWLPDGNLAFGGRKDEQVKIRGHRIELGEIESAINNLEGIVANCVVVKETTASSKHLVCYYTYGPAADHALHDIRKSLVKYLPDHMIPARFVSIENLPLTQNGKIDRQNLTLRDDEIKTAAAFKAPSTELERSLSGIWQELLSLDKISIYDNFFEIGGDSILVIQVVSRARKEGILLKPKHIFEYQTIATLSENIINQRAEILAGRGIQTGRPGLLPVQQHFFDRPFSRLSHFNKTLLLAIDKASDLSALNQSINDLVSGFDALRLLYFRKHGAWTASVGSLDAYLEKAVWNQSDDNNISEGIEKICDAYQLTLDIEKGELIKIILIPTPQTEEYNRLLIVAHRLSVDDSSLNLIVNYLHDELLSGGKAKTSNKGFAAVSYNALPDLLQYYATLKTTMEQYPYWKSILKNYRPLPSHSPVEKTTRNRCTYEISVDSPHIASLEKDAHQAYGTKTEEILLAALISMVGHWCGESSILIGLERDGRQDIAEYANTENMVGCFTNLFPVLLDIDTDASLSDLIKSVKEQVRSVPGNGMGYGLLKYMHPDEKIRDGLADAKWDIQFNYSESAGNAVQYSNSFKPARENTGKCISDDYPMNAKWEITCQVVEKRLNLAWAYDETEYQSDTIEGLARDFFFHLKNITGHCTARHSKQFTLTDYALNGKISKDEFEEFAGIITQESGVYETDGIDILKF